MATPGFYVLRSDWEKAPRPLARDQVLFAIGDVHGHADHLSALHRVLRAEIASLNEEVGVTVVRLGDYIDRGPDPLGTIDLAIKGLGLARVREVNLEGNHERYFFNIAVNPETDLAFLNFFIDNGGISTLAQCGVRLAELYRLDMAEIRARVVQGLGSERMAFLESLALTHRVGDYLCVHAGINPERPLDDQDDYEQLTIREKFLYPEKGWNHDVTVVHGHSISAPVATAHRIGVDTGAFLSGALTAVQVQGDRLRFLTVVDRETEASQIRIIRDDARRRYAPAVPIL